MADSIEKSAIIGNWRPLGGRTSNFLASEVRHPDNTWKRISDKIFKHNNFDLFNLFQSKIVCQEVVHPAYNRCCKLN